ncbi:MAG: deoxyribonuclease V [Ignavibacteriales bacterium]|nr:deoxyribonuclease V [Ignavibacteriales bacterium]
MKELHHWTVTPAEAVEIQQQLRSKIKIEKFARPIKTIAGCDLSFDKHSDVIYAGIVVLQLPHLREIDRSTVITKATFPYIPGLLSFHESPAVLEAWAKLNLQPDAVIIDGHGYAHPRRIGIACHLGLVLDLPTLGCAKSILVGKYKEFQPEAGCYSYLIDKEEIVGAALRTKRNVKPVYVSIGNRITLEGALELIMKCVKGYRIPEPTRQAHLLVNSLRSSENMKLINKSKKES